MSGLVEEQRDHIGRLLEEIARLREQVRVLREECRATRLVCRLGAMHRVCGSEIEFEDARRSWHACQNATDDAKAMDNL